VHRDAATSPELAGMVLEQLERAYERLVRVLRLPSPLPDGTLGGSAAFDVHLVADSDTVQLIADPPRPRRWDSASGFCRLGVRDPTLASRSATLCIGEAIALALDAAETPHARRAYATELWWITGSPTDRDLDAIDELQSHPERSIWPRDLGGPSTEGSALLVDYLDVHGSAFGPAGFGAALFAASATKTAPVAREWDNEPDLFDVLRHTLDERSNKLAALVNDLAVSRAFLGTRDDGTHLPWLAWAGDFGRVRFDWVLPFASLPRRVAATRPIDALGSIYVWVSLDGAPRDTTLGFRMEWEPPSAFVWTLVRIDRDGNELSRVDVPFQDRVTEVEQRVTQLDDAAAVIVVGTNLGGIDLAHPFDPDWAPFEPHGCTVYVARL
jgi:hypothetical protein